MSQKDLDGYFPKEQLKKSGFEVWVYYEKGDIKTSDELHKIIDSISVK